MALIVVLALVNPLVSDALYWGHPEELLTASLAIAAILAASEGRGVLTAVLAGLAIASKQWAVLVLAPAILLLERDRIRALLISGAVAALAWLPMVVVNLVAFRHALRYVSHPQPVVTLYTWLYPFSPTGTVTVTNIFGDARTFDAHQLLSVEAILARPLITLLGHGDPAAGVVARGPPRERRADAAGDRARTRLPMRARSRVDGLLPLPVAA